MIYQWKSGAHFRGDPQKAGEALEGIREKNGGFLTPQSVVVAATAKRSGLHGHFEWDDAKAAVKHRETQARELIRAVVVVLDEAKPEEITRAFVNVAVDDDTPYTSIVTAMSDASMRGQVLAQARREFSAWQSRYEHLEELAEVFAAMDKVAA